MIFIDTNIFIRFFVNDGSKECKNVERFFNKLVAANTKYMTSTMVIAEIVWVLEKYYKMDKKNVCENIRLILDTPNIIIKEKQTLHDSIEIFRKQNIDFIDAYNYTCALKNSSSEIISYDRHFDRLNLLKRTEP